MSRSSALKQRQFGVVKQNFVNGSAWVEMSPTDLQKERDENFKELQPSVRKAIEAKLKALFKSKSSTK